MTNNSMSRWIIAIVAIGILCGIIGGAVMGGAVGYFVASNRAAVVSPASSAVAQLASNKSAAPATSSTTLSVTEDSAVVDVAKKAEPAVVTVVNTMAASTGSNGRGLPFGNPNSSPDIAEGSGVIIDTQGHIITNAHVVDGAQSIDVIYSDGTKVSAKLIGEDTVSDIAVLQVSGQIPATLSLGDSNALQLGEGVVAIGSPLGNYRGSVTTGVVSGLNRSVDGTGQEDLIQTDAAINHGNSGGPLLNLAGQVIGINTLVVANTNSGDLAQGLGFAIPSNTVKAVADQLIAKGSVQYPYIGIGYTEVTPALADEMSLSAQNGVLVQQVSQTSPAGKAGIQQGDIITAMDGSKIDESHSLRSLLFQHQAGDTVTLTVNRNGQTLSIKLTLIARPAQTSVGGPG